MASRLYDVGLKIFTTLKAYTLRSGINITWEAIAKTAFI